MEMLIYAAGAIGYSLLITVFTMRVSGKRRGMRPRPDYNAGCDSSDLIDPTVIFEYEELDGQAISPTLLLPQLEEKSESIEPEEIPEPVLAIEEPEDVVSAAERVIQHLLQDGFTSLYELLQTASTDVVIENLPLLFNFRDDERFIMAIADLMSNPDPVIQGEMRRQLDELDDEKLVNELITLTINQTHAWSMTHDLEMVSPELAALELPELLRRMNRETNEEKLLELAGALGRFPEEETLAAMAQLDRPRQPVVTPEPLHKTILPPEPLDGHEESSSARHLAMARIGVEIHPSRLGEYSRQWYEFIRLHTGFEELATAARDENPHLRGRARIALARTRLTARTWFLLRDGLFDSETIVRSATIQAIREFSTRAVQQGLLQDTRDIRQLLLSHMLEETDPQVINQVEQTLFMLERNPENQTFQSFQMPEMLKPKYRGLTLEYKPELELKRLGQKKKKAA